MNSLTAPTLGHLLLTGNQAWKDRIVQIPRASMHPRMPSFPGAGAVVQAYQAVMGLGQLWRISARVGRAVQLGQRFF